MTRQKDTHMRTRSILVGLTAVAAVASPLALATSAPALFAAWASRAGVA